MLIWEFLSKIEGHIWITGLQMKSGSNKLKRRLGWRDYPQSSPVITSSYLFFNSFVGRCRETQQIPFRIHESSATPAKPIGGGSKLKRFSQGWGKKSSEKSRQSHWQSSYQQKWSLINYGGFIQKPWPTVEVRFCFMGHRNSRWKVGILEANLNVSPAVPSPEAFTPFLPQVPNWMRWKTTFL